MPVRVTFASATTAIVPRAEVPACPAGKTFASASVITVGVPTEDKRDGRVATACPLTPTPLTADVADSPVTDIFWLVTRVMLPKAEVPTKPLRERFDLPVTESVPKADVA
jgi:hypothetical protein